MAVSLNNFAYTIEDATTCTLDVMSDRIATLTSDLVVAGCSVTEAIQSIKDLQDALLNINCRVNYLEAEQEKVKSRIEPLTKDSTENPNEKGVLEILNANMENIYKNILDFDFMPNNMFIN